MPDAGKMRGGQTQQYSQLVSRYRRVTQLDRLAQKTAQMTKGPLKRVTLFH
jgi:hypothetical protein